jgi:hypothetical protein
VRHHGTKWRVEFARAFYHVICRGFTKAWRKTNVLPVWAKYKREAGDVSVCAAPINYFRAAPPRISRVISCGFAAYQCQTSSRICSSIVNRSINSWTGTLPLGSRKYSIRHSTIATVQSISCYPQAKIAAFQLAKSPLALTDTKLPIADGMFEPWFQPSLAGKTLGTGVILLIVRQLVCLPYPGVEVIETRSHVGG